MRKWLGIDYRLSLLITRKYMRPVIATMVPPMSAAIVGLSKRELSASERCEVANPVNVNVKYVKPKL